jgi:hypothetical protein
MAGHGTKLPRKQEQAIAALLSEPTVAAAAAAADVSERTLRAWLTLPAFRSAYRAARSEVLESAVARLQRTADRAVETLEQALSAPRDSDRIRAATAILDRAQSGAELSDLLERIEALEAEAGRRRRRGASSA